MPKIHLQIGDIIVYLDDDKPIEELLNIGSGYLFLLYDRDLKSESMQAIQEDGQDEDDYQEPISKHELKVHDALQAGGMFV